VGVRALLVRLAGGAPVPVFPLAGAGAREHVDALRLRNELALVDAPRAANVLLVAGRLTPALVEPARAVHDQLSHPRAVVAWRPDGVPDALAATTFPDVIEASGDVVATIVEAHRGLLTGERSSSPPTCPPAGTEEWRGVGPYGQGGKGMTGGAPYGRPMTGRAPDRDGMELDQLPVTVGPFFPPFPPGLVLHLKLQGDVVQVCELGDNPYIGETRAAAGPFAAAARGDAVPLRALEFARARHHLTWTASFLRVQGLAALGRRVLTLAGRVDAGHADAVRRLRRALEATRALSWATAGVGLLEADCVGGHGLGPVARAAGVAQDARLGAAAYDRLGFEPVVGGGGDARARWRQRLDEAAQALELAGRAGERRWEPGQPLEGPRGSVDAPASARLLALLPDLLPGLEWGDAVTTITSLDLDVEEAAWQTAPVEAARRAEDAA
jgi:hypothetical protein